MGKKPSATNREKQYELYLNKLSKLSATGKARYQAPYSLDTFTDIYEGIRQETGGVNVLRTILQESRISSERKVKAAASVVEKAREYLQSRPFVPSNVSQITAYKKIMGGGEFATKGGKISRKDLRNMTMKEINETFGFVRKYAKETGEKMEDLVDSPKALPVGNGAGK